MNVGRFYLPTLAEWRAFILGAREFRLSMTAAYDSWEMQEAYDCGREFAHWATFRRYEV